MLICMGNLDKKFLPPWSNSIYLFEMMEVLLKLPNKNYRVASLLKKKLLTLLYGYPLISILMPISL